MNKNNEKFAHQPLCLISAVVSLRLPPPPPSGCCCCCRRRRRCCCCCHCGSQKVIHMATHAFIFIILSILMGGVCSCLKSDTAPPVPVLEAAAERAKPDAQSKRNSTDSKFDLGVDDYGAQYRFPLRKTPTIRHIASSFRAAKHHNTRIIFWVDCNHSQENADLTSRIQQQGITIERHSTTASALMSLSANTSYQVKQTTSPHHSSMTIVYRYSRQASLESSQTGRGTATRTHGMSFYILPCIFL
jgi:hypothetical protein